MLNTLEPNEADLVLDASSFINLIATDFAEAILTSMPWSARIEHRALREVFRDPRNGNSAEPYIGQLIGAGLLRRVFLEGRALGIFGELTGAPAPDDLGDGEAATIAYAWKTVHVVATDDRKALRICRSSHPEIRICSTIDLFRCEAVISALGRSTLQTAVRNALSLARMRVPTEHRSWVASLLADRTSDLSATR